MIYEWLMKEYNQWAWTPSSPAVGTAQNISLFLQPNQPAECKPRKNLQNGVLHIFDVYHSLSAQEQNLSF